MTGLLLIALLGTGPAPAPPQSVTVATPRGELELPVRTDASGGPIVFASPLVIALGGDVKLAGAWAEGVEEEGGGVRNAPINAVIARGRIVSVLAGFKAMCVEKRPANTER